MAKIKSTKENLKQRLGSDVQSPLSSNFKPISGTELLIQDITQLLLTIPGERPGRPDFGSGLKTLVWENIEKSVVDGEAEIRTAIIQFEPRVSIIDIISTPNSNTGLILFNIIFRINNDDNQFNLVFPFRTGIDLSSQ